MKASLKENLKSHYIGKTISENEFSEIVKNFVKVRTHIRRYERNRRCNVKLVVNYIIILFNSFEPDVIRGTFKKILTEEQFVILNTFLVALRLNSEDFEIPGLRRLILGELK